MFIEKVWARPTDGKSSIFTFGKNYGQWQGIIASNEIEPEYVVPTTWMKHFDVPKAMKKQERKNHIKQLAKSYINKNNFTAYHWKGIPTLATALHNAKLHQACSARTKQYRWAEKNPQA